MLIIAREPAYSICVAVGIVCLIALRRYGVAASADPTIRPSILASSLIGLGSLLLTTYGYWYYRELAWQSWEESCSLPGGALLAKMAKALAAAIVMWCTFAVCLVAATAMGFLPLDERFGLSLLVAFSYALFLVAVSFVLATVAPTVSHFSSLALAMSLILAVTTGALGSPTDFPRPVRFVVGLFPSAWLRDALEGVLDGSGEVVSVLARCAAVIGVAAVAVVVVGWANRARTVAHDDHGTPAASVSSDAAEAA